MNKHSQSHRWMMLLLAAPLMTGCVAGGDATDPAPERVGDNTLSFEEFEATTYRMPETGVYIVDGDTPVENLEELHAFYEEHFQPGALTIDLNGGSLDMWNASTKLNLTYCVGFGFGTNRNAVLTAMVQAGNAWQAAAGVRFVHDASMDPYCGWAAGNDVFDVMPVSGQPFLAASFFPKFTRPNRVLNIDATSFGNNAPITLTGILRHELGHVLGFRHEQVRLGVLAPSGCFEDWNWSAVTSYDSNSVMHYPQCNGTNTGDLVLTAADKAGAASIYGGPLPF